MQDAADLIRALTALAWPVVVGIFLWHFKAEIAGLLSRIREFKAPGVEAKLDPALDRLQERTSAAEEAVPDQPVVRRPTASPEREKSGSDNASTPDQVDPEWLSKARRDILAEAARSPKAALILLAGELERQLRELRAVEGGLIEPARRELNQPVRRLAEGVGLAPELRSALDEFQRVRTLIVHGRDASSDEILRAIDLGLSILGAVARTPRQVIFVEEPRVELFADAAATEPVSEFHGVLLRVVSSDTPNDGELRVYPTTRTHFRTGEAVAWEWNPQLLCLEAWWRDPGTGHVFYGWTESVEFVGTHLSDL